MLLISGKKSKKKNPPRFRIRRYPSGVCLAKGKERKRTMSRRRNQSSRRNGTEGEERSRKITDSLYDKKKEKKENTGTGEREKKEWQKNAWSRKSERENQQIWGDLRVRREGNASFNRRLWGVSVL
jgi:hypothetical protein